MISSYNLLRVVVRVSGILLLMTALTNAHSQEHLQFARQFAPQEGLVAPAEKPYRSEECLNGSWQFQPIRLPIGFQQGKGQAPELPPPSSDGWEKTPIRIPSPWNVNSFADHTALRGIFAAFPVILPPETGCRTDPGFPLLFGTQPLHDSVDGSRRTAGGAEQDTARRL